MLGVLLCLGFMGAACSTNDTVVPPDAAAVTQEDCVIRPGDVCLILVFGHKHLSQEYVVDSSGRISFLIPLVDSVEMSLNGLTCDEAEHRISEAFVPPSKFEPAPKIEGVSVECFGYPPVYIIEGDGKPVPYPYRRGMRVINLIAVAGGFTYRALEDECVAFITRVVGKRVCAGLETLVFPGDVIEIKVRYF